MDFYWIGLIFWILIIFSILFLVRGLKTKSIMNFVFSALIFLPISYYFSGAENVFKLIMFYPIIPIIFALFFRKKKID